MTGREERLRTAANWALREQARALELRNIGHLPFVADDQDCPDVLRLAALTEELGEVARCLHDNDREGLTAELVQLAGIALAWSTIEA